MHDPDGPTPKPASTWGNAPEPGCHNVHYRTPRPPAGYRCKGIIRPTGCGPLSQVYLSYHVSRRSPEIVGTNLRRPVDCSLRLQEAGMGWSCSLGARTM